MARKLLFGAVPLAVAFWCAGSALAAAPPNWVAALYVDAQKMVGLRWTPVPGATAYKVLRSATAGSGYVEVAAPPTPQHFDKDLEPGTTYYYVLQAVDAAGPSPNSQERSVVIPGEKKAVAVEPPEWDKVVPQSTTEFGKVSVKVGLFWNPAKGNIAAYNVYRSLTPGSGYTLAGSGSETQYVDTAVEVGKTYFYVLTALDAATFTETPYSKEQAVEIKAPEKREKKKQEKIVQKFRVGRVISFIDKGAWGNLSGPSDIDVDWEGKILFVSNLADKSIYRFSFTGEFLSRFGAVSKENPRGLAGPKGLDWDPVEGILYVTDSRLGRVVMFDGEGVFKGEFTVLKEHGENIGKENPVTVDVCASPDGEQLAVIDNQRHKVLIYDNKGKFLKDLSVGYKTAELGSFTHPTRCVYNPNKGHEGDIIVADTFGARVQVFEGATGKWRAFGELGEVAGSFKTVIGVAVDRENHIWTADQDNFIVTEWSYDGVYLDIAGQKEQNQTGNNVLLMGTPIAVAFNPSKDEAFVANYFGGFVYRIELTPEIVEGK